MAIDWNNNLSLVFTNFLLAIKQPHHHLRMACLPHTSFVSGSSSYLTVQSSNPEYATFFHLYGCFSYLCQLSLRVGGSLLNPILLTNTQKQFSTKKRKTQKQFLLLVFSKDNDFLVSWHLDFTYRQVGDMRLIIYVSYPFCVNHNNTKGLQMGMEPSLVPVSQVFDSEESGYGT